jgi:putative ABC transport system permease protein
MLGIIIGIAAVIILVSIVNGFKQDMVNQFEEMGTNQISVTITPRGSNRRIEVEDMYGYAQENPDTIAYISPTVSINGVSVKFGTETASSSVTGVGEDYGEIKGYDMAQGRFLQYMDVERRQKNCVVGSYIAKEYFNGNACKSKLLRKVAEEY